MVMIDYDYDGEIFDLDTVHYGAQLESAEWRIELPRDGLGEKIMVIFIDIYGNEAQELVPRNKFAKQKTNKSEVVK